MRFHIILLLIVAALIAGCNTVPQSSQPPLTAGSFQPATGRDLRIVVGQTVYVPAYSEVFFGTEGRNRELAVTLAIHNTDFDAPIILQSVRFHDTDGNLVRSYIEDPVEVAPLATTGFLIPSGETEGGWGSNFIVEWVAEEPVHGPLIEAVMISTQGTHGLSLISPGRVLTQSESADDPQ